LNPNPLCNQVPIQAAVLDGFGEMGGMNVFLALQVGNGSSHLSSPSLAYLFSKPINWLGFDPSYPKKPKTFGNYIRKFRKEKGLLIKELAKQLGVTEDTVINWEKRGRKPAKRHIRKIMDLFTDALPRFFQI